MPRFTREKLDHVRHIRDLILDIARGLDVHVQGSLDRFEVVTTCDNIDPEDVIYQACLLRSDNSGTLLHTCGNYNDDLVDAMDSLYEKMQEVAEEELHQGGVQIHEGKS